MTMNNTTSKESSKLFTTGILPTFTFVVDGPEGMLNKNESQQQRHTKHRSSQHTVGSNEQRQKQPHGKEDTADITLSTTTTRVVPPGPLHIVPSWQPLDANDKPPYSYATLIAHAILSSEDRRLTLGDIYQWITQHYPFYSMSENGWQNSIRHNLSLNKAFVRIQRSLAINSGKGSFWTIRAGQELAFIDKLIKRRGPIRKQLVNLPCPLQHSRSSPRLGGDPDSYFASSSVSQPINTSPLFTTFRMTPAPSRSRSKSRAKAPAAPERLTKRKRSMPELHRRQNSYFMDPPSSDEYAHDSDCDSGIDVGHEYTQPPNKQQHQINPQLKKASSSPCLSLDHSTYLEGHHTAAFGDCAFPNLLGFDDQVTSSFLSSLSEGVNPMDTVDMASLLPLMDWNGFAADPMGHYLPSAGLASSPLSFMDTVYQQSLPPSNLDPVVALVNEPLPNFEGLPSDNLVAISTPPPCLDPLNDYLADDSFMMNDWIV